MPIEPDLNTLLTEGEDVLAQGKHDRARKLFQDILDKGTSSSRAYRLAERYMRHLGDSDDAESFRLLTRIAQEKDPRTRLDLLTQALDNGLEIALLGEDLVTLREQVSAGIGPESERGEEIHAAREQQGAEASPVRSKTTKPSSPSKRRRTKSRRASKRRTEPPPAPQQEAELAPTGVQDAERQPEPVPDAELAPGSEQPVEPYPEQERQAREWMAQGDRAREEGYPERARELYEQALSVPDIGPELRADLSGRIETCESEIARETQLADLCSQAGAALEQARYADALALLEQADELNPGDPRLEDPMRRARVGAAEEQSIRENLAQAQEKEADQPWLAAHLYGDARARAQELGLEALAAQAQESQQRVDKQIAAEVDNWLRQAEAAVEQKDWNQAARCYEEALRFDPRDETAQRGKKLAEERKAEVEAAEALKKDGLRWIESKNFAEAIQRFREALERNPDDRELQTLLEEAEHKKADVEAALDTIKLMHLPYATPTAMQRRLDEVLAADILPAREFARFSEDARWLFRREATGRLREYYLEPTLKMAETGDFAGALLVCEEALAEWQPYLEQEQGTQGSIPALRSRLAILEAYLGDLKSADKAWAKLRRADEQGIQALEEGRYEDAVKACRKVLRGLRNSPGEAHYLLGKRDDGAFIGIWQRSRERFLEAARGLALGWEVSTRQAVLRAESCLGRDDPKGAAEVIDKVKEQIDELGRLKREHDEIAATGWPLAEPLLEQVNDVKQRVDTAIKSGKLLVAAREHLTKGELDDAESCYEKVAALQPESHQVKAGQRVLARLREVMSQQRAAFDEGDLSAERGALIEIVRLAPQCDWANQRLGVVKAQLEQEQQIRMCCGAARQAKSKNDPEIASDWAQKVLAVQHDDEMQDIVIWAKKLREGRKEREDWKKQARAALKEGRFQDAKVFAQSVLAQDSQDREAQSLQDRAQQGLALEEKARELRQAEDYEREIATLERIPEITGAQEGTWLVWLNEAQDALSAVQDRQSVLKEIKEASGRKDWFDVLRKARSFKDQDRRFSDHFRKAERSIRQMVASAVESEDWATVTRGIQALRAAGFDDNQIREWDRQRERADLLGRARLAIRGDKPGELESAIVELDGYLREHPDDEEAISIREQAQIALLRKQIDLAWQIPDFKAAEKRLREALGLRLDPETKKVLEDRLESARTELALAEAEAQLKAGNVQAAGEVLEDATIKGGDPRIVTRLDAIRSIKELLDEATALEGQGDFIGAVRKLDEVLRQQSGFSPAVEHRSRMITDLLTRGQQARAAENWWEAYQVYKTLQEIEPQEAAGLDDARKEAESRVSELAYQAHQAWQNPDVEWIDVEGLRMALESVPLAVRQNSATLNQRLLAMRKRSEQVRTVDDLYQKAWDAFQQAHQIGEAEYARVEQLLDSIGAVDGLFLRRKRVRDLRQDLKEHRARRSRVVECMEELGIWRKVWKQPVAAVGADFAAPVCTMRDEGVQLLEQAMALNREITAKDGTNLYGLRVWPDPSDTDPLDREYDDLVQQKANLENVANLLLEGIKQRDTGDTKSQQAQQLFDESKREQDYRDAKALWEQAAVAYGLALDGLKAATTRYPPLSTRTRSLVEDAATLADKVTKRKEEVTKRVKEVTDKLKELAKLRASAEEAYGKSDWPWALQIYQDILAINSRDSEALKKRGEVERKKRDEEAARAKRQRNLRLAMGGGISTIGLVLAVWYFGFGPGRPPAIVPPTPTLAITPGSAGPGSTHTPIPSPGTTPTPTPAGIAITRYETPRSCSALHDTFYYSLPDETRAAGQNLYQGKGFLAVGETSDGKWLIVELSGEQWYVLSADAGCAQ